MPDNHRRTPRECRRSKAPARRATGETSGTRPILRCAEFANVDPTRQMQASNARKGSRRSRAPALRNALVLAGLPEEWELELLLPVLLAAYKECVAGGASTNAA